jgi:peptidoglycan/xylan/chitin deacetylase (PgdA/CDA1 family)
VNKVNYILLFFLFNVSSYAQSIIDAEGAIVRSDTSKKTIYLCFTGHDFDEGFEHVINILSKQKVVGSFFLTGDFVRSHANLTKAIDQKGHYVGAHSDKHLLYCDWTKRDSLLHAENQIKEDISQNLISLKKLRIGPKYFMPPYEWYNKKIVEIALEIDQITVNFSPGTRSNADYTTPDMPNYISSKDILESIYRFESMNGMHGFHLLIHPGTSPKRTDKFYLHLDELITNLKQKGYQFSKF